MTTYIDGTVNRPSDSRFYILAVMNPFSLKYEEDCSSWRKGEIEAVERFLKLEGEETQILPCETDTYEDRLSVLEAFNKGQRQ